jgi:hypothetical protein
MVWAVKHGWSILLAVVLLAVFADIAWPQVSSWQDWSDNQRAAGFRLFDLTNPPPGCTDAVGLQFVTPGNGYLFSSASCGNITPVFPIPSGDIVGDPNNVAFFDPGTGRLTDDNNLKWISPGTGLLRIGPSAAGFLDRIELLNTNATNNARITVINDGSGGTDTGAAYQLCNDLTCATKIAQVVLNSTTTSTANGGANNLILSNPGGNVGVLWDPSSSIGEWFTRDGTHQWIDGTGAVSASGTSAIRSNTHQLEYSENGGPWIPFDSLSGGTVTSVTGTPPIFITSTPTVTPNVTIQGAIVSGSTSTTAQDLGALTTGLLKGTVSGGVSTISTAGACTDYVSVACQTPGASDISNIGTNDAVAVIGITDSGGTNHLTTPVSPWTTNSLVATSSGGDLQTQTNLLCAQMPTLTGDVTTSGGTCDTTVVAIHETSGPTKLTIGAIPDDNPEFDVVGRPSGASTLVGVAASLIADNVTKVHYYINTAIGSSFFSGSGLVASSRDSFEPAGVTAEMPNDFKAGHVHFKFYLQTTVGITSGAITCSETINGSVIAATSISFTPSVTATPVILDNGTVATGASSAGDTFGVFCSGVGPITGAIVVFGIQTVLTP